MFMEYNSQDSLSNIRPFLASAHLEPHPHKRRHDFNISPGATPQHRKAEDQSHFSSLVGVMRKLQLQQSWSHIIMMMVPKHISRYHTKLPGKAVCLSADLGKGEHSRQNLKNWCLNSVSLEPFVWYVPFSILPVAQTTEVLAYFQTLFLSKSTSSLQIKTKQIEFIPWPKDRDKTAWGLCVSALYSSPMLCAKLSATNISIHSELHARAFNACYETKQKPQHCRQIQHSCLIISGLLK